jgi:hypothetical protein
MSTLGLARLRPAKAGRHEGRAIAIIAAVGVCAALVRFALRNLPYAGVSFDEATQFWMSEVATVWASVVRNGADNLDPGGFTLLLHFWIAGGRNVEWLRMLPLLLFLAGILTFAALAWRWRRGALFAVFASAVPLGYPLLLQHATEVRAYSMEFLGIAAVCLVLPSIVRPGRGAGYAGIILALCLTTRYSQFVLIGGVAVLAAWTLLHDWRGQRVRRSDLIRYVDLWGPVAVCTALVYALAVRPQTLRMKYVTDYFDHATLQDRSLADVGDMLLTNFFSLPAMPLTIAICLALASWAQPWFASALTWRPPSGGPSPWRPPLGRPSPWRPPSGGPSPWRPPLGGPSEPPHSPRESVWRATLGSDESQAVYRLVLVVTLLTAALWYVHPWDMRYRYSLYLHALSAVTVVRIAADLLRLAERRGARVVATAGCAMAAFIPIAAWHGATYERRHPDALPAALTYLDALALPPGSVLVHITSCPGLRYLYEYGPFAGHPHYPDVFRCKMNDDVEPVDGNTRYLISVVGPSLVPEGTTVSDPSMPPNLYKVRTGRTAS